jgi:hypothetical protein
LDFEILFWLLFLLAPFISRWLQKNKAAQRKPQRQQPAPQPSRSGRGPVRADEYGAPDPEERQLSPFHEALRQIQEALEEAHEARETQETRETQVPEPIIVRPKPAELHSRPSPPTSPRAEFTDRFRDFESSYQQDSFYDEEFESKPAYEEPFHETVHSHLEFSGGDEQPTEEKPKKGRTKWQEAYVMAEVLGKPRSQSRWHSRLTGPRD